MPINRHPGTLIAGGTFQVLTHYKELHIPTYRVSDANRALVTPGSAGHLLDGEFVKLEALAGHPGGRRIAPLSGTDLTAYTIVAGATNDTLTPAALDQESFVFPVRMRGSRGEQQTFGQIPVIEDNRGFEFLTRLINTDYTYAAGDKLHLLAIAVGKLPTYAQQHAVGRTTVIGLVPFHEIGVDAGAASVNNGKQLPYRAICLDGADAHGWIRCRMASGFETFAA